MHEHWWLCLAGAIVYVVIFADQTVSQEFSPDQKTLGNVALNGHNPDPTRDGKVFSLFSIVTFKNDPCQTTDGTTGTSGQNRNGTCYTSTECTDKGGQAKGNCAAGFGVCCLFVYTSASTITQNCSYIQNPGFPSVYSSTTALTYTIEKCTTDVCEVRLDFETFQTMGPTVTTEVSPAGACVDSFVLSSTASGLTSPVICGSNAGQHLYMDVSRTNSGSATIAFTFGTTTSTTRKWEIKVTQIPCSSNYKAPEGCLQYHTGLQGTFQTFNFAETTTPAHLYTQDYSICIRQEEGYCCVEYAPCADTLSYSLSSIGTIGQATADSSCTNDYVGIDGVSETCSTNGPAILHTKMCGTNFNLAQAATTTLISVCDCTAPFSVNIYTDATIETTNTITNGNRGVCFTYRQVLCGIS